MDDAIHTLSGTPVTAVQALHNCRLQDADRIDIFHCPLCQSIVFLCKEDSPYFRHQAHRGENCKLRCPTSDGHDPQQSSTGDQPVKNLAQRLLDAVKLAMGEGAAIPIASTIDETVAAALMGREILPVEGLEENAASVLYHPYFAAPLRWILACIQKQTNTSAMEPKVLAAFVQQQCHKPLFAGSLGNTIRGGERIVGGLEPLQLPESGGPFEFEVLYRKAQGRPRMLYR